MNVLRVFWFMVLVALAGCSSTDFFLGKDNHPPAKPRPQGANAVATQIFWTAKVGDTGAEQGFSLQPAIIAGTIYTVSHAGILQALDATTGAVRWRRDLQNRISAGVGVSNDEIFVASANGDLIALRRDTGQPLWRQPLSGMMLAPPVPAGGLVLARTSDGSLFALDAATGQTIWRYHSNEPTLSIRGNAQPLFAGGVVILTTDNGYFVVLNPATGAPILEQRITAGIGSDPVARLVDMDTTPQIHNGILFGAAYQSMVFAIDLQAGQPSWRQPDVSTPQDIALNDNGVFVVNDIDHIIALDQQTGNIRWENDQLEGRYLSPPVALGNMVGVLDNAGYLYWLDADTGQIIGQHYLAKGGATSAATVFDGRVIWQLNNGKIISFRPEKR